MKFLIDESVDARLAAHVIGPGHEVTVIAREYPASLADTDVLRIAHREGRILITNDRDFGDLVFRLRRPHSGVIYFRLSTTRLASFIERLDHILTNYSDHLDQFIVVTDRTVRIRPSPPHQRQ